MELGQAKAWGALVWCFLVIIKMDFYEAGPLYVANLMGLVEGRHEVYILEVEGEEGHLDLIQGYHVRRLKQ
jgi:hypothetical protein